MNRLPRIIAALGLLCSTSIVEAKNDAGLAGEFLNIGVGARPMGMGRAYTGVADDIDSLYWNPAGLASYRSSQIEFQHSPLPVDGAYQYLAFSQPLYALGNLGIGVVNLTSGDIDRFDDLSASKTGTYESRETAYMLAYANRFKERFHFGFTGKMAEKSIDGKSERGYGADVGALYAMNERFRIGATVRNVLAPSYKYSTETEKFPAILRAGASMTFLNGHLLSALDVDKALGEDQSAKPHFGLEGYVINNFFLRAGIDETEIATGFGLKWKTLQFDYSAGFQDLGLVNRFSMKVFFGGYEVDVKASPEVFSPVGLKNKTVFKIQTAQRNRVVNWILAIRNAKGDVVRSFQGYNAPPSILEWDGRSEQGQPVEAGLYTYRMMVTDTKNRSETTPVRSLRIEAPTPFEIEVK